jgi:hypothetical protein
LLIKNGKNARVIPKSSRVDSNLTMEARDIYLMRLAEVIETLEASVQEHTVQFRVCTGHSLDKMREVRGIVDIEATAPACSLPC